QARGAIPRFEQDRRRASVPGRLAFGIALQQLARFLERPGLGYARGFDQGFIVHGGRPSRLALRFASAETQKRPWRMQTGQWPWMRDGSPGKAAKPVDIPMVTVMEPLVPS